jgi:hypothetical protein
MFFGNRDSSFDIATGHGLDGRGSVPANGQMPFIPQCPERLWIPPISLTSGYRVKLPGHEADNLDPVQTSRMVELYFHSYIRLQGVVFNYRTTLNINITHFLLVKN